MTTLQRSVSDRRGEGAGYPVASPTMVGREPELAALIGALSSTPSLALIEGEAGIGKTRLVQELQVRPELAGRRFLMAGCPAIQEPFPLGPMLGMVRNVRDEFASAQLSPVAGALRPLLPELSEFLPPVPEPLESGVGNRHRVFRGLLELLQELGPVTIALEDVHWADEQTIDFLRYLLSDRPDFLSMVVTFRGHEADPRVPELGSRLPAELSRAHVALEPLDTGQTGQLAAAVVAVDHVPREFAADLCARTGGLPFAIEEVMALLREHGMLERLEARSLVHALNELSVPTAVRDHVLARVRLLPELARSAVEALAVLRRPATEHLVAAVAAAASEQVSAGLSQAIEAGLLRDAGEAVELRHVLAAQAIYQEIPGPRRRTLHHRAAAALPDAAAAAGHAPEVLGQVAHHLRQAGRLAEWVPAAELAADRAVALGHPDEAVRLLEEVLRHAPVTPPDQRRLAVKLGWAASGALRAPGVIDLLASALEGEPPPPERAELQMLLGAKLDRAREDAAWRRELFQEAAENVAARSDVRAWAMVALAFPGSPEVITDPERRRWIQEALATLPMVDDRDFRAFLLGKAGMLLADLGDPRWWEVVGRIEQLAASRPRRHRQINAYWSASEGLIAAGHYREADRLLAAATPGVVASHDRRLAACIRLAKVELGYHCGRWDGLGEEIGQLREELSEWPQTLRSLDTVAAGLALAGGEFATAERLLTRIIAQADAPDPLLSDVVGPLVRLALANGDVASAFAAAKRYLAGKSPPVPDPTVYRVLPWLVKALVVAGEWSWADSVVTRCGQELDGCDAPLKPAALPLARGHLAVAADDPSGAAGLFFTAAEQYEALWCSYDAAQARELAAVALAAAGRPEAVAAPLRAAVATYQRLGATWDLDRAAGAARQLGVSVPARHRGGNRGSGTQLTSREREVAELAATGLTNKEIAGRLFLSPATVKKHLESITRKLGVPSRAALGRQLTRP